MRDLSLVSLLLVVHAGSLAGPGIELREVHIQDVDPVTRLVRLAPSEDSVIAPGSTVLVAAGNEPLAWAEWAEAESGVPAFRLTTPAAASTEGPWQAWLIPPDLVARLIARWPDNAPLRAEVDSVGPGGQSAWINAGTNQGVNVGDSWWLRVAGQPAARCDVRFAADDVCFCAVVALANAPTVRPGARVALWPGPAERRTGRATSAVAFVEERAQDVLVWIAAPPNVNCPSEPHVDLYRAGRYLGHGLVERRDDRFWYVRLIRPGGSGGSSRATSSAPVESKALPVRVGDNAVIRTHADINGRRFLAHIFELSPAGALLNAGEADGLAVGDVMTVSRRTQAAGRAVVRQVQRSYAVVEPVSEPAAERVTESADVPLGGPETPPLILSVGDALRFGDPPEAPRLVGTIRSTVRNGLFAAQLTRMATPVGVPLAVRLGDRTIGAAVLVTADAGRGVGFALPCSLTEPLLPGMRLEYEPDSSEAELTDTS